MSLNSPYFEDLRSAIRALGGLLNAHLHLDRSGTLNRLRDGSSCGDSVSESHLSLPDKHQLISSIHAGPAFEPENVARRVNTFLDSMIEAGTARADSLVDVTADRVGLSTLEMMLQIKEQRKQEIDLRLGSYTPMGFLDSEPVRWEMFEKGAQMADFIGSLPERDDPRHYPGHIGFAEHCRRMLQLGRRLGKPIQIHLDQHNDPRENETEEFLNIVREVGLPRSPDGTPMVWAIHLISPSLYDDVRFSALLRNLHELNIGVVCCPSAALSMRQLRPIRSPTCNSIARVLEMLSAGVHVRLGSDNIADICSPAGTPDLLDEVFVLCNALRFYDIPILAKLAAGQGLDEEERRLVEGHLEHDRNEVEAILSTHAPVSTTAMN